MNDTKSKVYPEWHPMHDRMQQMSLRDYFAAKAMPSFYKDYAECARNTGWDEDWQMGIALDAYKLADAMLKARNQ